MREPYETLLGQFHDHWFLGQYLTGTEPNFVGIMDDDLLGAVSTGELILLNIAYAFEGDRTARVADITHLDDTNRRRVVDALYLQWAQ